ncbi:MAG: helix-turn-helix domain-containing protein [Deltaproteobacteria bacterium]|nr:helix-turn-helix domain-containing protein [Deltaproteobacteria bacterium]
MGKVSSEEKITIQAAARALGVSKGTVVHYLNNGKLTRLKEGSKVYILMDEIRALLDGKEDKSVTTPVGTSADITEATTKAEIASRSDGTIVVVDREHYEELLTRLGQLELEKQNLLVYKNSMVETKAAINDKERQLEQVKAKLLMMEEELRLIKKMGWWKRLLGRKWRSIGG